MSNEHRSVNALKSVARALGSLDLQTVEAACHNLRYKVDYHLIQARLKYYSNSKNPRVIHTKLDNERLETLRTHPHDPYLVRPGEFLTLAKQDYISDSWDGLLPYYYGDNSDGVESCPEISPPEPTDKTPIKSGNKAEYLSDHRQFSAIKPWHMDPEISDQTADRNPARRTTKIKRHIMRRTQSRATTDSSRLLGDSGTGSPFEAAFPKTLRSPYTSPVQSAGNALAALYDKGVDGQRIAHGSANESPWALRHRMRSDRKARVDDDKKVWQMVLSDISLSAARLSTGSEGTSREDYESLKGDLTEARARPQVQCDFFAENLKQGKAKFHGAPTTVRLEPQGE